VRAAEPAPIDRQVEVHEDLRAWDRQFDDLYSDVAGFVSKTLPAYRRLRKSASSMSDRGAMLRPLGPSVTRLALTTLAGMPVIVAQDRFPAERGQGGSLDPPFAPVRGS